MSEGESRHAELVTLVFEQFKKSFDLEIALDLVPMRDDKEREEVGNDSLLKELVRHAEAEERERIITGLRHLAMSAESEGVQLSALDKYGKMLYPKRFKETGVPLTTRPGRLIWEEVESAPTD